MDRHTAGEAPEETIRWRVALRSGMERVFEFLATAEGRERFWAESAPERGGTIHFRFPNGERLAAEVLEREPPSRLSLRYFGGSRVVFSLEEDSAGGCVVTLEEHGLTPEAARENAPGWVSVLLALKAAADHGVDLRNRDPRRTWGQGFVDN